MPIEGEKEARRAQAIAVDEARYREEYQRQPVLTYPPRWITFGITSDCNYRCSFCSYHSPDGAGISKVSNMPFTIRLSEFRRIVDMALAGSAPKIHICGTGKPFLHKGILDMIDYAADVYERVSVQSNFFPKIFKNNRYLEAIIERKAIISYVTMDFLSGDPQQHEKLKDGHRITM